jgi:hypothetical protein
MSAQHTPTPWEVNGNAIETVAVPSYVIGSVYEGELVDIDAATADANAEFICRAANSHEELVRVLKWFADPDNWREEQLSEGFYFSAEWKLGFDPREMAKRVLAKAEGRS